jgi:hypothetical protein
MNMLSNEWFQCRNKDTYPPFKNGLYLEEYCYEHIKNTTRKYIPVKWTNFQIEGWFQDKKQDMQKILDEWIQQNPAESYFTVVQHDDGPLLHLPKNTIVYGACSGNIPIPLIYEDSIHTLESVPKKSFFQKKILCSFVGNITSNHVQPNVRDTMMNRLTSPNFLLYHSGGWNPNVSIPLQQKFIDITVNSKFSLAPRGYGRGSFRFFECFKLGTIPIYIWNDVEWLPFQQCIDYKKLCISIPISKIDELESILLSITEEKYNSMFDYYYTIRHLFELDGMCKQLVKENTF